MNAPLVARRYTGGHAASLLRNCGAEVRALRGTEEAGRHVAQPCRIRPRRGAHRARTAAGNVAEDAPEGAEAAPAGIEGNVGDGPVGIAQQCHRPFDAAREQVAMRRHAEGLPEGAREVRRRHAAHARQPRYRPVLLRGRVHAVPGAQQAAQQIRGLCRAVAGAGTGGA